MLMSHMESKEQRWPNVRFGEIGDVSAVFNYGFSDMMMNNLWVYDFNTLEESQIHHISGFPDQGSSEFTFSNPTLSSSTFFDDPNLIKNTNDDMEMTDSKAAIKKPRSKRCRRTVFEGLYGSIDNQGSVMSKQTLGNDVSKPVFKKQKGANNLENYPNGKDVDSSVGRWLEDVGFGRYAGVFEMHEVDEEALPLLTLDDLKEMGVLAVGPRRKLYAAICRIRG